MDFIGYLLAKIHMVAKLLKWLEEVQGWLSSSKNPYGSKTVSPPQERTNALSSSKNPYGSKTCANTTRSKCRLSSSKNPYGSKTDERA